jgi:hypothetical protein
MRSFRFLCFLPGLLQAVTLFETVYAPAGIDQLLPTGIERMALGANFNPELILNRTAKERLAAGATNDGFAVSGMYVLLHIE